MGEGGTKNGRGERESGRELHNAALHNLYSNIMVKEGKANYEAWHSFEGRAHTFRNIRH